MAGDWIAMRTRLSEERSVLLICEITGLDEFSVIGRLHAVWSWAGEHTVTGDVTRVTLKTVDRIAKHENFGAAMRDADWLQELPEGGLRFPRWKRHNHNSAKQRVLSAKRSASYRARRRDASRVTSVTNVTPTGQDSTVQNNTEEKRNTKTPLPPHGGAAAPPLPVDDVVAGWNALGFTVQVLPPLAGKRLATLRARLREPFWRERWLLGLAKVQESGFCRGENDRGWRATFDWFVRPDTVRKLIEGQYDGRPRDSGRPAAHSGLKAFLESGS